MDEDARVQERLERIDHLRERGGRVFLLAEVRKLLADAEAALAARDDPPGGEKGPPGPPSSAA